MGLLYKFAVEKNGCILMLHRDCSSMCDWRVVQKLRCSNSWLERHTPPPSWGAAESCWEGSAWMQSQSQRHEAQLHFGLVPVYRKILNDKNGNVPLKAPCGHYLASISSTPNGKLEMHTSLQAPITLMHSWPMKKKLLQFNYEKGKISFIVKTIEFHGFT